MEQEKIVNETNTSEETATTQETLFQKLGRFMDVNYALFFAPLIVAVLYAVSLYVSGVWPFGQGLTAASYDLSAQICPFIEHLFDVLDGKSSLFYSYAIAGGADVTGTFLYFFISPFSFIFLLAGDGMVAHMSSIVMTLKLASICVAGVWFAKYLFKGIPEYMCAVIGVVYAYCGYMFLSNTYINWMDFLIYMPFTAAAFIHYVKTGKTLPFAILIACCVYTCFSIACFAMFTAFPCLVFYGLLCGEKGKKHTLIAGVCWAFVIAILLSLPILLPALSAYLNGGRGGDLFENFWYGFTVSDSGELISFNAESFWKRYSESLYKKFSYILSDTIFVVLTIVWFFRRGLKDNFAKFMLVCGIFTLLPAVVDESMLLMNMGSYMQYALRFGFLNAVYFLGGACLALEDLCYDWDKAYDGTQLPLLAGLPKFIVARIPKEYKKDGGRVALSIEKIAEEVDEDSVEIKAQTKQAEVKRSKGLWAAIITFGAVALAATIFLLYIITNDTYLSIWDGLVAGLSDASSMISNFKSMSGRFAHSEGGLEVIALLAVIVAVVALVGVLLVRFKAASLKIVSYMLIVVVGVQVLFYNNQIVVGNRSSQHIKSATFSEISQTLNDLETDENGNLPYFRVKDFSDNITANAPFSANFNSVSVFSSVIDADNFATFHLFGYKGNGKNSLKSAHSDKSNRSDEFGDSFWGYKYIIVRDKAEQKAYNDSVSRKKWWKPLMITGEDGEQTQYIVPDKLDSKYFYYVYENTAVFPLAFTVDDGAFTFAKPNEANSTYRKYNQQALYKFLRGKTLSEMKRPTGSSSSEYVTPETAKELAEYLRGRAATEVNVGAGKITVRITAQKDGECLFMPFVASKGYTATVNGKNAELVENDLKLISVSLKQGENVVELTYSSPYVKYALVGLAAAVIGLCVVAFVLKKTKLFEVTAPVISWAGIALSVGLVAFFMIFPTVVWCAKTTLAAPVLWENVTTFFSVLF
ncbi:MAG: YfhO family protein [Clostridia bacterium]|nr:YfhO family protein [Clostridia bacterium]